MNQPFFRAKTHRRDGFFFSCLSCVTSASFFLYTACPVALAADGALEALELRYQAELAIAEERSHGKAAFADAMQDSLSGLLQEYLVTRDGSIALDTVDDVFVQEQFKQARAMEEPGVALALDVFAGGGTGYEHGLRTSIANLADFQDRMAGRVSEAALDAHERVMERHLDKLQEHQLHQERLETKLESRLDGFEPDRDAAKVEAKVEAVVEKVEKRVEAVVEQAEKKVEANPDKSESITEKAEKKIDAIVDKAKEKLDDLAGGTPAPDSSTPGDGKGKKK